MFLFICVTLSYIVLAHAHRPIATGNFGVVSETGGEGREGGYLQPVCSAIQSIFIGFLGTQIQQR